MTTRPKEVEDFCTILYRDVEGYAYLPTKNEEGAPSPWDQYFFKWPEQKDQLVRHAIKMGRVKDVYISPSLFSKPNAELENCLGSNVLWVDADGTVPSNELLAQKGIPHSPIRVESSPGRQHMYWQLEEFCTDIKLIQDLNRALAYDLGGDPSGWDMNQVLRPVGTWNHKRGNDKTQVTVAKGSSTKVRYSIAEFDNLPKLESPLNNIPGLSGNLPNPTRLIGKYVWTDKEMDLLYKPETGVEEGTRSSHLTAFGHILCEKGMTDAEVYSMLTWVDERWKKFSERDDAEKRYLGLLNYLRFKHPYKSALDVEEDTEDVTPRIQLIGYRDMLTHKDNVKWLIEPQILSDTGCLLVAARSGVGKTNLTTELGFRLILNRGSYLDWTLVEPEERHTVVHLQLEMSLAEQKEVALKMDSQFTEEERDILQKHYLINQVNEKIHLYNPVDVAILDQMLEHYKPSILTLDSTSVTFAPALKEDEKMIRASANHLSELRQKHNVAVILVGHAKKNTTKEQGMDAFFGMSVLEQYLTSAILLTDNEEATEQYRSLNDDQETKVIDVTYAKKRFGAKNETYSVHLKSNPLRFERPIRGELPPVAPKPKKVPVPKQNDTVVDDFEQSKDYQEALRKFNF